MEMTRRGLLSALLPVAIAPKWLLDASRTDKGEALIERPARIVTPSQLLDGVEQAGELRLRDANGRFYTVPMVITQWSVNLSRPFGLCRDPHNPIFADFLNADFMPYDISGEFRGVGAMSVE